MGQVRAHMPLKPLLSSSLLSLFLSLHFRLACSFTHSQQAGPSLCNMITANLFLTSPPSFGTPNDVEEDDDGDDGDNDDGIAH